MTYRYEHYDGPPVDTSGESDCPGNNGTGFDGRPESG